MNIGLRNTLCGALICAAVVATPARAAPRLEGAASPECLDTLAVATTAFYSKHASLNDALALPADMAVQIITQPVAGDDLVSANNPMFKVLAQPKTDASYGTATTFWQVTPTSGIRWVLAEVPFNWRGDTYSLYAVDPAIAETAFVPPDEGDTRRTIIDHNWTPPMMLRDRRTKAVWAVDTAHYAEAYVVTGSWAVFTAGQDGVKQRCLVTFGPKVRTVWSLLPAAARTLAVDLDGTLGDGHNEGTLNQTGTIRMVVSQAWLNIALRPWAVTTDPYNTRHDADAGLKRWSYGSPGFRTLYQRIQAEYPAAVDALADLYVKRFGKAPQDAHILATHNLDIAYRSHFVFPQYFIR